MNKSSLQLIRHVSGNSRATICMNLDPKKTVVVTGLGVMSGVGSTLDSFWENLLAGKSSVSRVTHFDPRCDP